MKISKKFLIILIYLIFIFSLSYSYSSTIASSISNNVFRLHIIANSDTPEDQSLKLKVRDSLLKYMSTLTQNCTTKKEAITLVEENIDNFKKIAETTINKNGFNYPVTIEVGNFTFPTKKYGNISLPSGNYDSLRVHIGDSKGHNWWCVMFPPLCFSDCSTGVINEKDLIQLKQNLSEEEYSLLLEDKNTKIFKFKIVEIINKIRIFK